MNVRPVRPKDRFLVFGAPVIEDAEIAEVVATLRSGWLGTGPRVARFESDFKAYKGAQQAVAVSSCTAALHLSLLAAGIKPGDEVITTALTFCATVNAIIHAGAVPVLVDVESSSMNMAAAEAEAGITERTRALIPVHFAGRPCAMDALSEIAGRHQLKIIEDCAHAIEAEYAGCATGTFGDFGCFSFYATKNIGVGVHYRAIPDHPYYQNRYGWTPDAFPHATRIGRTTVSLPLSAGLSDEDVGDVVRAVRQILS